MAQDSDPQPEQSQAQQRQPSNQELLAQIAQLYRKAGILQQQMNPAAAAGSSGSGSAAPPSAANEQGQPTFPPLPLEEPSNLTKQQRDRQELFQYLQGRDAANENVRGPTLDAASSDIMISDVAALPMHEFLSLHQQQTQVRDRKRGWNYPHLQEPAVRLVPQYREDATQTFPKRDAFDTDDDSGMAMTHGVFEKEGDLMPKRTAMTKATDDDDDDAFFSVVGKQKESRTRGRRAKHTEEATIGRLDAYDEQDFDIRI